MHTRTDLVFPDKTPHELPLSSTSGLDTHHNPQATKHIWGKYIQGFLISALYMLLEKFFLQTELSLNFFPFSKLSKIIISSSEPTFSRLSLKFQGISSLLFYKHTFLIVLLNCILLVHYFADSPSL